MNSVSPTNYSANQFMELFKEVDEVFFPANQKIKITDINKRLKFVFAKQMIININKEGNKHEGLESKAIDIINDILFPINKVLASPLINANVRVTLSSEENYIFFEAADIIRFNTKIGLPVMKISDIFNRMERSNIDTLNIPPNQKLFLKLNNLDRRLLVESKISFETIQLLFSSYLPKEFNELNISLKSLHIKSHEYDNPRIFSLESPEGISLSLKRV